MSPTPPHETRSEAVHEYEDPQAGAKAVNNAGKFAPPQDEKPTHNSQSCNSLECKPHATGETDLSVTEALNKPSEESPEPYYAPAQVPAFKALQKKRLTGTRTKQLLRAAGRAHDDPPPPPELGLCCGSSCDPCVNDLWREELSVWKERWGGSRGGGRSLEEGVGIVI
ncbi:hypothetical protein N7468_004962 [Penicillium chermesinum]|uniref:Oxidoreductase-like domain-containing protein n=1 Tax=Penicillium chermesinum TaxID=63820 RepID=A0A9W9NY98_9EURO|nr:uncharacterized protein N7468_004962 [Penicillium chermesinum]KAJ5232006.1 hypothetical protein N7468_004962 [Penicillium chermesinum]